MYADFNFDQKNYSLFKDGEHVFKTIKKNLNTTIESINGKVHLLLFKNSLGLI